MGKFIINKGDYIDSREFSREECERFCELAVECGFEKSICFDFKDDYLGISAYSGCVNSLSYIDHFSNNITAQFREFLDKEKGVKKFKVGDKVKIRKDSKYYRYEESNPKDTRGEVESVYSGGLGILVKWDNGRTNAYSESDLELWQFTKADLKDGMRLTDREGDVWWVCDYALVTLEGCVSGLDEWNHDLTEGASKQYDIIRVTDRDGTVLFEREEEPREISLEEIAEAFNLPVERVRIKK